MNAQGDGAGGGVTDWGDTATIGTATFINEGGTVDGGFGGLTLVRGTCAVKSATFINNPGTVSGALGGLTYYYPDAAGALAARPFSAMLPRCRGRELVTP